MKKQPPSSQYLKILQDDLVSAGVAFQYAKAELYKYTATAKLGEPAFEMARIKCLETTKAIEVLEIEIARVRKAL